MNDNWRYWLSVISIGIIIASAIMAIQIYYNEKFSSCISNPLKYASQVYEEKTGYKFIGSGSFIGENLNSPIIYFNSDGIRVGSLDESYNTNNNKNILIFGNVSIPLV